MYVRKKLFVVFCCCSTAFNSVLKLHFFFKHCEVLLPVIIAATAVLAVQRYSQECWYCSHLFFFFQFLHAFGTVSDLVYTVFGRWICSFLWNKVARSMAAPSGAVYVKRFPREPCPGQATRRERLYSWVEKKVYIIVTLVWQLMLWSCTCRSRVPTLDEQGPFCGMLPAFCCCCCFQWRHSRFSCVSASLIRKCRQCWCLNWKLGPCPLF